MHKTSLEEFKIEVNLRFKWIHHSARFIDSERLYIGKMLAVECFYSGLSNRDDPLKYECQLSLMGTQRVLSMNKRYETIEEAKEAGEQVVKSWIVKILEGTLDEGTN